jgi:XapX domain-containing protein
MKVYLVSLGAGLLVGVAYSLLNVRSPAPPVVALIGLLGILLGILLGEQIIPVGRQMIAGTPIRTAWQQMRGGQHVFGALPGRHAEPAASTRIADVREVRP